MSDRITITKIEAARSQINTAIRMFFHDMDVISIHAVAAGALQIVTDLAKKDGKTTGIEGFLSHIIEERRGEFLILLRRPQNFIKHADREGDEDALLEYNPDSLELFLFLASQSYEELTGKTTPEIKGILTWVSMRNPEILLEGEYKQSAVQYIETHGILEDKEILLANIDKMRLEQSKFSHTNVDFTV